MGEILLEFENATSEPSSVDQLYLGNWRKGEIEITGIKSIEPNRFFSVITFEVLFSPKNGDEPTHGTYRSVRWNDGVVSGAAVLPITPKGEIVLIESFRHALREWTIEIPRGGSEKGETLARAALREAQEEAGVMPSEDSELIELGEYHGESGLMMQRPHLFALTHAEIDEAQMERDETESSIKRLLVPIEEVLEMVDKGLINDGFTLAAILRATLKGCFDFSESS